MNHPHVPTSGTVRRLADDTECRRASRDDYPLMAKCWCGSTIYVGPRPGDAVVDPDGRTDGVDTVGRTHVNVIDHDRVHHIYLPGELGAA